MSEPLPTVDDRIAQTVAAMYLERRVEPVFHPDSYGYVRHEVRGIEGGVRPSRRIVAAMR